MIESHPDNALEDLRLDQPFDEFTDHLQSYDLDSMDKKVWCVFGFQRVCVFTFVSLNYFSFTHLVVELYDSVFHL